MSYPGTPEQKAIVDNFVRQQRAATVTLWQLHNQILALEQAWNSNVLGIIGAPSGVPITDGTNLAGAQTLTDTQVTNLYSILQTMDTNTFTDPNKVLFALAIGVNSMQ